LKRKFAFFYETQITSPSKKKSKISLFAMRKQYYKQYSFFYGFFKPKILFKIYTYIQNIKKNNFFFLFMLLETRILNLLFRVNFLPNLYFSKQFILHNNVFVDNHIISDLNYTPSLNSILSLNKKFLKLFYFNCYRLIKLKALYLNTPAYCEVDYKLFVINVIRQPLSSDITQSFSFNRYSNFLSFTK
jgi:ribosomal protein S4